MKNLFFLLIALFLVYPITVNAQQVKKLGSGGKDKEYDNDFGIDPSDLGVDMDDLDDIFGDSEENPFGGIMDIFGGAMGSIGDKLIGKGDLEKTAVMKKFEGSFKNQMEGSKEFILNLDNYTSYTKCFYLMIKYINVMDELKEETENTQDCKRKYDLHGMQLMAMMSSTSIMYCTEDLFNKLLDYDSERQEYPNEFDELNESFVEMYLMLVYTVASAAKKGEGTEFMRQIDPEGVKWVMEKYEENHILTDFEKTIGDYLLRKKRFLSERKRTGTIYFNLDDMTEEIAEYFHPMVLTKEAIAISEEMDKLKPCAVRTN